MKKYIPLMLMLIPLIFVSGCIQPSEKEKSCIESGGEVLTGSCCLNVGNFPNTCLIGACGCSPTNSHDVKVCNCPEGMCFDGNECSAIVQCTPHGEIYDGITPCCFGEAVADSMPDPDNPGECIDMDHEICIVCGNGNCDEGENLCNSPEDCEYVCYRDEECVPAQCCHPTRCVPLALAPDCTDVTCTLVCEGPIDCRAGFCGCLRGECTVIPIYEIPKFKVEHTGCLGQRSSYDYEPKGWWPMDIKEARWDDDVLQVIVSIEENCCGTTFDGDYAIRNLASGEKGMEIALTTIVDQPGPLCRCLCPYEQTFKLEFEREEGAIYKISWFFQKPGMSPELIDIEYIPSPVPA